MAHYKRRRPRTKGCGHYSAHAILRRLGITFEEDHRWSKRNPRYWDKVFHIRPARSRTHAQEHAILRGEDPDNMVWPTGRKPRVYYW